MTEQQAPYNISSKFVQAVGRQFRQLQDDPQWITDDEIAEILALAAVEIVGDETFSIRLQRQVSPEKPRNVYTLIETTDFSGTLFLSAGQVAELLALLATWNPDELRPGTAYVTPTILSSGVVVSEWQPWHDDEKEEGHSVE